MQCLIGDIGNFGKSAIILPAASAGPARSHSRRRLRAVSHGRQRRIPENSAARLPERKFQDMLEIDCQGELNRLRTIYHRRVAIDRYGCSTY
jgi:hypothetical protein